MFIFPSHLSQRSIKPPCRHNIMKRLFGFLSVSILRLLKATGFFSDHNDVGVRSTIYRTNGCKSFIALNSIKNSLLLSTHKDFSKEGVAE